MRVLSQDSLAIVDFVYAKNSLKRSLKFCFAGKSQRQLCFALVDGKTEAGSLARRQALTCKKSGLRYNPRFETVLEFLSLPGEMHF